MTLGSRPEEASDEAEGEAEEESDVQAQPGYGNNGGNGQGGFPQNPFGQEEGEGFDFGFGQFFGN